MKSCLALTALVAGWFGLVIGAARAEVTADQVRQAIDRGTGYLLSQQRSDGSWSEDMRFGPGAISALCTLALLNAGVDPEDERLQKAFGYLRKLPPQRTYTVALQTMALARTDPERYREVILRNVKWLESTQIKKGLNTGAWTYGGGGGDGGDNSNSQFALLGLHEAERIGVSANDRTWRLAKKYWEDAQNPDGSWGYRNGEPGASGSMTCAGISSLVIASDRIQSSDARVTEDRIECCVPREPSDSERIDRAIQWLGQHYSVERNPNWPMWHLYYLYGLERAGRLTARRFLPLRPRLGQPDRADWYREGADHLIGMQDSLSGFWRGVGVEGNPPIGTSLSLLFLSKGRWPVLLGKLQFGGGGDWNLHRGDVGNLTRFVEMRWRRDLTWQVVDLRVASVEDLLQTPVIFLCGSQNQLPLDPGERKEMAQKLRDYLDRGGFLFADANCGGAGFDTGFRELMQQVFPEPEYKLHLLDKEHPIWYAEEKVDPQQMRSVLGIEFGCRTSVVYAPPDPPQSPRPSLSCLWELARAGRGVKYSPVVQAQIDAALSLGINVLAYATNRELRPKDEFFQPTVARRPGDQVERGRIYVAKLKHPGGCNVAPRAIVNLMDSAGRELKVRTHVREELLDITDPALYDYHLVFMHGRTAFRLTDAERQQLRQYVERGGMLLADSICASKAFSESFRREMGAIFPSSKLEPIAPNDPLLTKLYGGFDLHLVSRHDPDSVAPGGPLKPVTKKVPPDLEGVKFGDRWGVIFSQYDLSCALEKRDTLECRGYTREDAAKIGLNVVLYSLQQ